MLHTHARRPFRLALLGGAAFFSAFAPLAAAAADPAAATAAAADTSTVEVTGTRESPAAQAAQNRPQAASVVDKQELQDIAAVKLQDIGGLTPGIVLLNNTPSTNNISAFIRGIGEPDAQGIPSVGIFIDGVYQPRHLGANFDLLNVQDITIERGPVGFEGGHDAEGGAIRITTAAPTNTPTLAVGVGYGTYNELTTSVIGSGPIVPDLLYGSLAVQHHQRDGFDTNAATGKATNDADTTSVRSRLRYTPNDRLEINLGFDATFDDSQARSYGNLANPNIYTSYNPIVPKADFEQLGLSLTVDYHVADNIQLKSITSIRGFHQNADFDNNADPYARGTQPVAYRDRSYEQDFRLTANYDRVDVIAGLYGFFEDWQTNRRGNTGTYPSSNSQIVYTPVDTQITQKNTELAAYAETKVHFTPELTGTFALRADYQEHTNNQSLHTLLTNGQSPWTLASGGVADVGTLLSAPIGNLIWATGNVQKDWFRVLPKVALEYAVEPNLRPYVSVSQGQKEGGFDFRAISPSAEKQALLPYNPEQLTTVELGLKARFFDNRLQFNTAAFYNYFGQLQNTFLDPTTNLSHRFNIGNAESEGLEAELNGTLAEGWKVNLSGTLLNAQLSSYGGVVKTVTYANGFSVHTTPFPGAELPYSPRAQGNIGSSYVLPIQAPGTWRLFGNVVLSSAFYGDLTNIAQQRIPGSAIVSGGVNWTSETGRWSATFTVNNLTDQRYPASKQYVVISSGANAGKVALYNVAWDNPLTAFFELRYAL